MKSRFLNLISCVFLIFTAFCPSLIFLQIFSHKLMHSIMPILFSNILGFPHYTHLSTKLSTLYTRKHIVYIDFIHILIKLCTFYPQYVHNNTCSTNYYFFFIPICLWIILLFLLSTDII